MLRLLTCLFISALAANVNVNVNADAIRFVNTKRDPNPVSTMDEVVDAAVDRLSRRRILSDPVYHRLLRREKQHEERRTRRFFKSQSTCSNGVGPTCGPFPIPANVQLDTSKNLLQPLYAVGKQTFAVYDPNGLAFPNELTDFYGYLLDYPTTINGVGTQTDFALYCPTDDVSAPLCNGGKLTATSRVPASALVAQGYIKRDAKTALIRFGNDGVEYTRSASGRCAFPAAAFGRGSYARGAAGALSGFVCSMVSRLASSAPGRAD